MKYSDADPSTRVPREREKRFYALGSEKGFAMENILIIQFIKSINLSERGEQNSDVSL
jgi:hypothetical protein